ncbi:hypothetical protein EKN56_19795 [Limnobaculum zhutongyuii]|uniref:Uncharacterized protein n=1 Tax=Limnobaculum zhutongyuii TaxID=2498113 RepID=A0A411WQK1_9GAMM|nr:hypothetical protein [Limnobaculum zhutongyuii]QBH98436.1 hypothetical protein EKN56_19795 [Limnobaculum zhutongyuii]TQS89666.1 hypothetical protein ELQ32_04445 [Limnobaculum zhutongyuii]
MSTQIKLNRKHIAQAFLDYCRCRNGGHSVMAVTVGSQKIILSDLTVDAISRCLTDCFEVKCFQKLGRDKAMPQLMATYSGMLNKDNTKLMPEGIEFMNLVMTNSVEIALKNPKDNTFGLEMY